MKKYSTPEETVKELLYLKIPFPRDAVEAAIQQKEEIITMKNVESDLSKPQKKYGQVYYEQLIKNTVEELQSWYCFKNPLEKKEEEEKIKEFFHSIQIQREGAKTGRNDPCPCGSGKKFKKCCLNKEQEIIH
jgi:uncharacterized protein YecA (UPF0149 family)